MIMHKANILWVDGGIEMTWGHVDGWANRFFCSVLDYAIQGTSWAGIFQKKKMKPVDLFCTNKLCVTSIDYFLPKNICYPICFYCLLIIFRTEKVLNIKNQRMGKTGISCFFLSNLMPVSFCSASAYIYVFTISGARWRSMLESQTTCTTMSRSALALACGFFTAFHIQMCLKTN